MSQQLKPCPICGAIGTTHEKYFYRTGQNGLGSVEGFITMCPNNGYEFHGTEDAQREKDAEAARDAVIAEWERNHYNPDQLADAVRGRLAPNR